MTDYLLDTSILVDYLRGQKKAVELFNQPRKRIISIITMAELCQGCRNSHELKKVKEFLNHFTVIPITEKISYQAIELIYQYILSHHLLIIDSLIATTALNCKCILLTGNYKHFSMIKGLKLEKWTVS